MVLHSLLRMELHGCRLVRVPVLTPAHHNIITTISSFFVRSVVNYGRGCF